MSNDDDRVVELKSRLADTYTAEELCEILGLTEWDILEMFEERVLNKDWGF